MTLAQGTEAVSGDFFPFQQYNRLKDHWVQSDPVVNITDPQAGMIATDSDDDLLYHYQGGGPAWKEILQADTPFFGTIELYNGAYFSLIEESQAEGLAGADLRIGLDESLRILNIMDRGDIDTDFGFVGGATHPTINIFDADATTHLAISHDTLFAVGVITHKADKFTLQLNADLAFGDAFLFDSGAGFELTDTNAQQAWLMLEPKVNQSITAAFDGLYINGTLTSLGDGSTGEGNNYLRLATGGASVFRIDTTGGIFPDGIKSGTDQGDAGAAEGELYQDTNDDNTIKIGI